MNEDLGFSEYELTDEEQHKFASVDLCNVLYTVWDKSRLRGTVSKCYFYTCRTNSNVPDEVFSACLKEAVRGVESIVEGGEVFLISAAEPSTLKAILESQLQKALKQI